MESGKLDTLQGLLETKQWEQAWGEFQTLKDDGPPSPRLLLVGSHAAFGRRDYYTARRLADEAMSGYTSSDAPKLLGQIRFHLGMVARKIGETAIALEQFQRFLSEMSVHYPELSMGEGKAYFYTALTLRERRELDGAVDAYRSAIACFRRDGLPSLLCMSLQNLGWLLCHMKRPVEARDCLSEAAVLVYTTEDRIHQLLGEAFLATIEANYLLAAEHCETVFRMAERGEPVSPEEQAQAAWVAGMVALEQGNLNSAEVLANMALSFATKAMDSRLMNDANMLKRSIHTRR